MTPIKYHPGALHYIDTNPENLWIFVQQTAEDIVITILLLSVLHFVLLNYVACSKFNQSLEYSAALHGNISATYL